MCGCVVFFFLFFIFPKIYILVIHIQYTYAFITLIFLPFFLFFLKVDISVIFASYIWTTVCISELRDEGGGVV